MSLLLKISAEDRFLKLNLQGPTLRTQQSTTHRPNLTCHLPVSVNAALLEHSQHIVYRCFVLQYKSWVVTTEITWLAQPKYLLSGPLQGLLAPACSTWSDVSLSFIGSSTLHLWWKTKTFLPQSLRTSWANCPGWSSLILFHDCSLITQVSASVSTPQLFLTN